MREPFMSWWKTRAARRAEAARRRGPGATDAGATPASAPGLPLSLARVDDETIRLTLTGLTEVPVEPRFALRREDGTYFSDSGARAQVPLVFPADFEVTGERLSVNLSDLLWLSAAHPEHSLILEVWQEDADEPLAVSRPWQYTEESPSSATPVEPTLGGASPPATDVHAGRRIDRVCFRPGPIEVDPIAENQLYLLDVASLEVSPAATDEPVAPAIAQVIEPPSEQAPSRIRIDVPAGLRVLHLFRYRLGLVDGQAVEGKLRVAYLNGKFWSLLVLATLLFAGLLWALIAPPPLPVDARGHKLKLPAGEERTVRLYPRDQLPADEAATQIRVGNDDDCPVTPTLLGNGRAAEVRLVAGADAAGDCAIPYFLTSGGHEDSALIRVTVEPRPLVARPDHFPVPRSGSAPLDLFENDDVPGQPARASVTVDLDVDETVGTLEPAAEPGRYTYFAPYGVDQLDRFRYRLRWGGKSSDWAEVTLDIGEVAPERQSPGDSPDLRDPDAARERPPLKAVDDQVSAVTGLPAPFDVLWNDVIDRSPNASPVQVALIATDPALAAALSSDGRLQISRANADGRTAAELTYRLTQDSASDTARVVVTLPPPPPVMPNVPPTPPPGSPTACRGKPGEPLYLPIPKGEYQLPARLSTALEDGLEAFAEGGFDLGGPNGGFPVVLTEDICIQRDEVTRDDYLAFARDNGPPGHADALEDTMQRMSSGPMQRAGESIFSLAFGDVERYLRYLNGANPRAARYRLPNARDWLAALLYAVEHGERDPELQALEVSLRRGVREFSSQPGLGGRAVLLGPSELSPERWVETVLPMVPIVDAGLRLVRTPEGP
jgi:hypothetical protein